MAKREGEPEAAQGVTVPTAKRKESAMATSTHREREHDKTLKDSFPASDPPANSGITGAEKPDTPTHERPIEERPTGTPNSDRHATETAHHREHEKPPSPAQNRFQPDDAG
jgi:hypothetical protein